MFYRLKIYFLIAPWLRIVFAVIKLMINEKKNTVKQNENVIALVLKSTQWEQLSSKPLPSLAPICTVV